MSVTLVLEALQTDDRARLPEPGPFNLGKWSWPVNLLSFLVGPTYASCYVSANSLTVQLIYLRTFRVAHGISCQRVEHELRHPGYRWSHCYRCC